MYCADLFKWTFSLNSYKKFSDVGFSIFLAGRFLAFLLFLIGYIRLTVNILLLDAGFQELLKDYWMSKREWKLAPQLLLLLPPWSPSAHSWLLICTEHSLYARRCTLHLWDRYYYFPCFTNEKLRFRGITLQPKITQLESGRQGVQLESSLHQNWYS